VDSTVLGSMSVKLTGFLTVGAILKFYLGWGFWSSLGAVFVLYLITGGWRFVRIILYTIKRDAE